MDADAAFCSWMGVFLFMDEACLVYKRVWLKFLFMNGKILVHKQTSFCSWTRKWSKFWGFFPIYEQFSFMNGEFLFMNEKILFYKWEFLIHRWSSFRSWMVSSCLWMRTFSFINGKFSFIDGAHFVHEW